MLAVESVRDWPAVGVGIDATAATVTGLRDAPARTVGAGIDATAVTVAGLRVAFPVVDTVGVGIDAVAATVAGATAAVNATVAE
ncbi:hypothetical protein AB0F72_09065 [Actinoplanes sp. NPDC023936]|uniref:hypothetical protein n=1 Tax=Actinoplanes sp. NPDC023936 TaxID=3154910 RepID=UPI0033DA3D94